MKALLHHFLTEGDTVEFTLFGVSHLVPILLMLAAIWLVYRFRHRICDWRHEKHIRYVMAMLLIISEMAYYWRLAAYPALSTGLVETLPISVCGWAVILCSYMVIGKSQRMFDIAYFWLLCGSVFALITPTPLTYTGPTRLRYYQFWLEHTLGYVAVFYMIFVHGMRPTVKSGVWAFGLLLVMAALAYYVNNALVPGANYLYMARPEAAPSVLDILPANFALRFSIMMAVILALFVVVYLPWYCKDRKVKAGIKA